MYSNLISVEEFFYQKHDVVTPHCNLWGDFNLSLNGTLELTVADQTYYHRPVMVYGFPANGTLLYSGR
jgi:hypothetical protein